ncbi:MAG: hypothetical protein OXI87_11985 [Albidovulum sp.]|nr:hypothetical protein [Albidovulum sp.]
MRRGCEAFGSFDARGRLQLTGRLSTLAAMERGGRVSLPPPSKRVRPNGPAILEHPVPDPSGVPDGAGLAEGFEQVPVLDLIMPTQLADLATLSLNEVELPAIPDRHLTIASRPKKPQECAFGLLGIDPSKTVAMQLAGRKG